MGSRGVVFGDVDRADSEFNARVGAAGEGQGVDVETPGHPPELSTETAMMLHADLFDGLEAADWARDLVRSYTGCVGGDIFDILMSMVGHALAIGVLTERPRWDDAAMGMREARLEAALRAIAEGVFSGNQAAERAAEVLK